MQVSSALDTRSIDEARTRLALPYCPYRLSVRGSGAGFRARHVEALSSPLGVFQLEYGAEPVVVRSVPFRDFVLVSRPVAGHLTVRGSGRDLVAGTGEAVALDPDSDHELRFGDGCRLLTIKLPLSVLERVEMPVRDAGRDRSRVGTGRARSPATWNSVTRFLLTEAIPHGLLGEDSIMRNHTVQLVAAAAVSAFGTTKPLHGRQGPGSAAFRRAVEFIDDRAHDDIGLIDIAEAAGVSVRALQYSFRRHLGITPLAHLRVVRLTGARNEIRADTGRTVAEIAYSWGFGNLGRFAAGYRRTFGCLPSEDRSRARLPR